MKEDKKVYILQIYFNLRSEIRDVYETRGLARQAKKEVKENLKESEADYYNAYILERNFVKETQR